MKVVPESLSVNTAMVMTIAQSVIHFDPDYNLATRECLTTESKVEALLNLLLLILLSK